MFPNALHFVGHLSHFLQVDLNDKYAQSSQHLWKYCIVGVLMMLHESKLSSWGVLLQVVSYLFHNLVYVLPCSGCVALLWYVQLSVCISLLWCCPALYVLRQFLEMAGAWPNHSCTCFCFWNGMEREECFWGILSISRTFFNPMRRGCKDLFVLFTCFLVFIQKKSWTLWRTTMLNTVEEQELVISSNTNFAAVVDLEKRHHFGRDLLTGL